MDEDKLGFLTPEVEEARVEEAPAAAPAAPEGPARGADGKFARAADAPRAPSVTAREGTAPPPPQEGGGGSGHVPISALLDEREKRQAAERRWAELQGRANPPPPPTRDEQLEAALYGQNLRASRRFAEREYGREQIATVHDWAAKRCDEDPAFNSQMRSSEDPYSSASTNMKGCEFVELPRPERGLPARICEAVDVPKKVCGLEARAPKAM